MMPVTLPPHAGQLELLKQQRQQATLLVVAARRGEYAPAEAHRDRITTLQLAGSHDLISSSEVRLRIEHGADWQALVPRVLHEQIRAIYRPAAK